jgi:single-strand DNA-binding protein
MNNITIAGRLTKDAQIKQVGDNNVASFSLAMDAFVKGEKVSMYFDCSVWGKRADTAEQYLKKGGAITVVGKLMPVYVKDDKAYLKVDVSDFTLPPRPSGDSDAPAPKKAAKPSDDDLF